MGGCESRNGIPGCNVRIIEPLDPNGNVQTVQADQVTPPFDLYFIQPDGTPTTSTAAVAIDDIVITVANVAPFSVGQYIGVFNPVGRYYFGTITAIAVNDLTLDTPFDFAFPSGSNVLPFTRDMNVVGTPASPKYFEIQGPGSAGLEVDITRFMLSIGTTSPGNINEFGNLTALTAGLVLRRKDSVYRNIWNIKTNLEFGLHAYDIQPFTAVGPGGDGLICRYTFSGQDKHGVAIRLKQGEALQLIIQDDLSGLVSFRCLAEGHETD